MADKEKIGNRRKKVSLKKKKPLFCTECGNELDIFWLTDMCKDKKAVIKNHENCVNTGKFNGEYCSKMFISGVYNIEATWRKSEKKKR